MAFWFSAKVLSPLSERKLKDPDAKPSRTCQQAADWVDYLAMNRCAVPSPARTHSNDAGLAGSPARAARAFHPKIRLKLTFSTIRRGFRTAMFDKDSLDTLFDELRDQYELEPDWEEIQRDAHLGVARLDGGVEIGSIDPRVAELVSRHNPG